MKTKEYNHTEKESSVLWNISVKCSIDCINDNISNKEFEKRITKFRNELDKLLRKKKEQNK